VPRENSRLGVEFVEELASTGEGPTNATANLLGEGDDLLVRRRGQRDEAYGAVIAGLVDAIEDQGVEVDVQGQRAGESLDEGDPTRLAVADSVSKLGTTAEIDEPGRLA